MATNFPESLDTLVNPLSENNLSSPSHADQHTNANDAIEALQEKVGVTNSEVETSHEYRISQVEEFADNLGNTLGDYVPLGDVGQPDGVASLDSNGKIPDTQLDIDEKIQDVAAQMIVSGTHTNITVSYNDNTGALSFTGATGGGGGSTDIALIIGLS